MYVDIAGKLKDILKDGEMELTSFDDRRFFDLRKSFETGGSRKEVLEAIWKSFGSRIDVLRSSSDVRRKVERFVNDNYRE